MFKVVKPLNNNIILALNKDNEEIVAFGTGIGFKKKQGDLVDEDGVQKIFRARENYTLSKVIDSIDPEVLALTERIIEMAQKQLNKTLSNSLLFSLSDHIMFALQRLKTEQHLENPIQWEVPHLYYQEYLVGKQAVTMIDEAYGIQLPTSEASFIALHIVNGQIDGQSMDETIKITKLTKEIVIIIQSLFEIILDKTSFHYSRFTTHLRYFINRQETSQSVVAMDEDLRQFIKQHYIKSYACGLMIKDKLEKEYGWFVSEDEIVYLVIHIQRIVAENKNKESSD
jgi:beta-glucoside operon transcriptional antiterminator